MADLLSYSLKIDRLFWTKDTTRISYLFVPAIILGYELCLVVKSNHKLWNYYLFLIISFEPLCFQLDTIKLSYKGKFNQAILLGKEVANPSFPDLHEKSLLNLSNTLWDKSTKRRKARIPT